MWSPLLGELLCYLLGSEAPFQEQKDEIELTKSEDMELRSHVAASSQSNGGDSSIVTKEIKKPKPVVLDIASISVMKSSPSSPRRGEVPSYDFMEFSWSYLFAEKLVPIIIELFLEAPPTEKCNVFPEIIRGLGR